MKVIIRHYFTALCLYMCLPLLAVAASEDYRLSVDDEISVIVYQEPDMSVENTRISTNGTIAMPLIGKVSVIDLTIDEVKERIESLLLGDYLKKPDVTVSITEYRPFYINGEIDKPGSYAYRTGLTLEKAVALAGGFTERASKNTITLIREGQQNQLKDIPLSLKIMPGDVITISQSFF